MNGRMKRFIEDTIISIVVVIIIAVLYYVVSNFVLKEDEVIQKQTTNTIVEDKIEEPSSVIDIKDVNQTIQNQQNDNESIKSTIEEKLIIENTEKKVDIQKLKQFITTTEDEIAKKINYNIDTNITTEDKYLKIRLTLLKSGDYEQLTFVDGNENLFEKNKENITKIFPLAIDKDIIEEFPRYLRIELRKKF